MPALDFTRARRVSSSPNTSSRVPSAARTLPEQDVLAWYCLDAHPREYEPYTDPAATFFNEDGELKASQQRSS